MHYLNCIVLLCVVGCGVALGRVLRTQEPPEIERIRRASVEDPLLKSEKGAPIDLGYDASEILVPPSFPSDDYADPVPYRTMVIEEDPIIAGKSRVIIEPPDQLSDDKAVYSFVKSAKDGSYNWGVRYPDA